VLDLTPTITGPMLGFSGTYVITVANIGNGPTVGPMTFTLTNTVLSGPGPVEVTSVNSVAWSSVVTSTGVTLTSRPGVLINPGTSVVTVFMVWSAEVAGQWQATVTLPPGIGGETNGTNNTASITVTIPLPPG
jgi:hypothetical protein